MICDGWPSIPRLLEGSNRARPKMEIWKRWGSGVVYFRRMEGFPRL
jgi:hypothetical protein